MTEERRKRVLSEEDLIALVDALAKSRPIADDIHVQHHEFIGTWIKRVERRAETMDKIKAQVGGWTIITLLGGVGYAVWDWVKAHLR